jgi:hypothetical protein
MPASYLGPSLLRADYSLDDAEADAKAAAVSLLQQVSDRDSAAALTFNHVVGIT